MTQLWTIGTRFQLTGMIVIAVLALLCLITPTALSCSAAEGPYLPGASSTGEPHTSQIDLGAGQGETLPAMAGDAEPVNPEILSRLRLVGSCSTSGSRR